MEQAKNHDSILLNLKFFGSELCGSLTLVGKLTVFLPLFIMGVYLIIVIILLDKLSRKLSMSTSLLWLDKKIRKLFIKETENGAS